MATGVLTIPATRLAAPVSPSTSQIARVTRHAPCTAPAVIVAVCAAWVVSTAPIAFIGYTEKGVS